MFIVLLVLFFIAVVLIIAGFLLSPRSRTTEPRKISYRVQDAEQIYRGGTRVYRASSSNLRVRPAPAVSAYEAFPEVASGSRLLSVLNVRQWLRPNIERPMSWLGTILILIAVFGFGLFALRPLFSPAGSVVISALDPGLSNSATPAPKKQPQITFSGASKAVVRLNQLDPAQYANTQQYNTWAQSACSAAAMTEVVNAYSSKKFRITDILTVESNLHQITPELGLLQSSGIGTTVSKFGLKTYYPVKPTLDDVIKIGNQGHPVIVNFPPDHWPGGHLLIVRGGNSSSVFLVDSSTLNMQVMARATFMKYWEGFAAVSTPA